MNKGLYIVFEGIDYSGKTTQMENLRIALEEESIPIYEDIIREPGGTPPGQIIRNLLVGNEQGDEFKKYRTPKSQVLGYNFDRAFLVENVIKPALTLGQSVVSDRCWISTIAYQHFAEKMPLDKVLAICEFAIEGCMPDHVFVLDITVEEAELRMRSRKGEENHYDTQQKGFKESLREGYAWAAKYYPNIVTVINGERYEEDIAVEVLEKTLQIYKTKNAL